MPLKVGGGRFRLTFKAWQLQGHPMAAAEFIFSACNLASPILGQLLGRVSGHPKHLPKPLPFGQLPVRVLGGAQRGTPSMATTSLREGDGRPT